MRCRNCGSLNTVKNGKRKITPVNFSRQSKRSICRYRCKDCGKYFSKRREGHKKYTKRFKEEVTRMHVEERISYRIISKRIKEIYGKKVSPRYISKMVNEVAMANKSSIEIKNEYKPTWEGYLTIDDKWIKVKGKNQMSLIAVDSSGDPIHSELISEVTQDNYNHFFKYIIKLLEYPIKAITTDLDPMLERAIKSVISDKIPHQKCIWHGMENIKKMINYQSVKRKFEQLNKKYEELNEQLFDKKGMYCTTTKERLLGLKKDIEKMAEDYKEREQMLNKISKMLFMKEREKTHKEFAQIRRRYNKNYPDVISFLKNNLVSLTMHQTDINIPRTTVRAENINRQLQRRFKTIEGFENNGNAFNYLNLIRNYLRFKPYTDCKKDRYNRNGKSPLELCKAYIESCDWIKNSINWQKLSAEK